MKSVEDSVPLLLDLNNRVTLLNSGCSENRKAGYVLYWVQMFNYARAQRR